MRHSKSAWPLGVADRDRPLSARGKRDAVAAGALLSTRLPRPELVLVSPAARTVQTLRSVESALGPVEYHVEYQVDERLYAASWWDLLDVIQGCDSAISTLMLLAHNPGIEDLVTQLAARSHASDTKPGSTGEAELGCAGIDVGGDTQALRQLGIKFPTSAIAVLRGSLGWERWSSGCARLEQLTIPRG